MECSRGVMPIQEKLCVFPIAQQVIGVGTVVYGIATAIKDLVRGANLYGSKELLNDFKKTIGDENAVQSLVVGKIGQHTAKPAAIIVPSAREIKLLDKAQQKQTFAILSYKWFQEANNAEINPKAEGKFLTAQQRVSYVKKQMHKMTIKILGENIKTMGVGIFRFIPVIPTIYYGIQWHKSRNVSLVKG